ncbi:pirin family protein [Paenibacillus sp. PL91]|uniref:pirin family protein n=1 Tax=Paenibacillus sp. PL91 TaxID=2729538 RepID=UPI00145CB74F|nr:pirin family protein [Paenibacillus sp. PL91]MBC9201979.1 pirin family protein [Paenibacillus sp. PL91]
MSGKSQIYKRSIKKIRTPEINHISSQHQNSFILEQGQFEEHDPFLILAEDWFQKGSFGDHPHRGIETVTYVIKGRLEHYDNSSGSREELAAGDAQWMTAGRGVIHNEDPVEGEVVHSLQLWVNLPAADKMTAPRYQNLRSADMPVREEAGAVIRVFSGSSGSVQSATQNVVPVTMVEFTLEPGASVKQQLPGSYSGFLYVLEGEGEFGSERTKGSQRQVLTLTREEGIETSELEITAVTKLRVMLYAGQPLNEPIVARGPFVMNTEEQIRQAYTDYRNGKFV